jgi:hypothetical protein
MTLMSGPIVCRTRSRSAAANCWSRSKPGKRQPARVGWTQTLATLLGHIGGSPDELQAAQQAAQRRQQTQDQLMPQAQQLDEHTADLNRESETMLDHHHRFAISVTLFQVAIGLAAIAALIRLRLMWWVSLGAGLLGALALVNGFTLTI